MQILSTVGVGILVFEMFVRPVVIKRIGIQSSQRWTSAILVLVVLIFPCLSTLRDERLPLIAISLLLMLAVQICANVVRRHGSRQL